MNETDTVVVQEQGVYWCQWWVKNHLDSTKLPTWSCRFWPKVQEKDRDGVLGRLLVIRPNWCERFLGRNRARYSQYQD